MKKKFRKSIKDKLKEALLNLKRYGKYGNYNNYNNSNNSNNSNDSNDCCNSIPAFSLVEISISLIVIAVILAALSPVITKRLTSTSTQKNKISKQTAPHTSLRHQGIVLCVMLIPKNVLYAQEVVTAMNLKM